MILRVKFEPSTDIVYLNRWTIFVTNREKFEKLRQKILKEFEKSRRDYFVIDGDGVLIIPSYKIAIVHKLENLKVNKP